MACGYAWAAAPAAYSKTITIDASAYKVWIRRRISTIEHVASRAGLG